MHSRHGQIQLGLLSCAAELKVILLSSEVATLGLVFVRIVCPLYLLTSLYSTVCF